MTKVLLKHAETLLKTVDRGGELLPREWGKKTITTLEQPSHHNKKKMIFFIIAIWVTVICDNLKFWGTTKNKGCISLVKLKNGLLREITRILFCQRNKESEKGIFLGLRF